MISQAKWSNPSSGDLIHWEDIYNRGMVYYNHTGKPGLTPKDRKSFWVNDKLKL